MSQLHIEIGGTLQPDGTLVLDQKPDLPPGRVRVIMETVFCSTAPEQFWTGMRAIWAAQQARGHVPRTKEEIDAEIETLRSETEEELREVEQDHLDAEAKRRNTAEGSRE